MKTNRLVVTLNKAMQTSIERGLNQIYANSNLVNEFVVRPSFLLQDGQSMWVTFKNAETNATVTLKPTLLAERRATKDVVLEVDNDIAQLPQEASAGCEYYTALPAEITGSASKWYFSIKICQIPQGEDYSDEDVVKQTQTKTGDVNYFTVYNSLAGAGPSGDAPSELDVVALYNTAIYAKGEAEQSAQDAESYAQQAQQAVQEVNASNYAPYVGEDGKWYQYSKQEQRYVNTGVTAQGPQGLQGERGLQGDKGDKGEKGEKGDRGEQGPAVDTSKLVTTDTDQTIISGKTIELPAESAFTVSNADGAMLSVNTLAGERAIDIDGEGVGNIPLRFNSDGGTEGQVLTSMGSGKTPQWKTVTKSYVGLGNVDNVKQYSDSNPPPYPVTSVNGKTGDVTIEGGAGGTSAIYFDSGAFDYYTLQLRDGFFYKLTLLSTRNSSGTLFQLFTNGGAIQNLPRMYSGSVIYLAPDSGQIIYHFTSSDDNSLVKSTRLRITYHTGSYLQFTDAIAIIEEIPLSTQGGE